MKLDQTFWNSCYEENQTGWDMGKISPPLKAYIDQLHDTSISVLIPGAGNAYEADYLLQKGFQHITVVDIAPTLVQRLQKKHAGINEISIIQGDFFDLSGQFDLILEQTFFCALPPKLRPNYVSQMSKLLSEKGKLVGLLFNRTFEKEGPPFGGNEAEYKMLFGSTFSTIRMEPCYNSHPKRMNNELFIQLSKGSL